MSYKQNDNSYLINSLIAGGFAGFSVDLALYPLDTIKTRIQSKNGFWKSGGFSKIYSGLGSGLIGSIPTASIFFLTYETTKHILINRLDNRYETLIHIIGASAGEITACLVRVPIEVIKQRSQANQKSSFFNMKQTYVSDGFKGFYRGYFTTVLREIPFSFIQYPLWEFLKKEVCEFKKCKEIVWTDSLLCGALSGAIAGFFTTPFDVAKTRIILAEKSDQASSGNFFRVLKDVYSSNGLKGLFSGALPRVLWISIGGAIFLGGYDISKSFLDSY